MSDFVRPGNVSFNSYVRFLTPALILALWLGLPVSAQKSPIVDGRIDDWRGIPLSWKSPSGTGPVRALSVAANPERLFIRFALDRPGNLMGWPGKLILAADADGNPTTGGPYEGLEGADIVLVFSEGVAVTTIEKGKSVAQMNAVHDFDMALAPTYGSRDIELTLRRQPDAGARVGLFGSTMIHWRLIVKNASKATIQDASFSSGLVRQAALPDPFRMTDPLARPKNTDLRVVVWNVYRLFDENRILRVLKALNPDVVILDEVLETKEPKYFEAILKDAVAQADWHILKSDTGGYERIVIASRYPLEPAFVQVQHETDAVNRLGPGMPKPARKPLEAGVTSAGAYIKIGNKTLLASGLDLVCCENRPDSFREQLRMAEASAIAEKIRAALKARPVDAAVVGGDLNLVSTRQPLEVLSVGMDPAGGNLEEDGGLRLRQPSNATTHADRSPSPYVQERLDYLLFSPSSLRKLRSFLFHSEEIGERWRNHYGIRRDDSNGSDHIPIVADFAWK